MARSYIQDLLQCQISRQLFTVDGQTYTQRNDKVQGLSLETLLVDSIEICAYSHLSSQ